MVNPSLIVTSESRPLRTAFLVDLERTDDSTLDQIMAISTAIWGGARFPIIPVLGGELLAEWRACLLANDPDLIISVGQLPEETWRLLQRRVGPLQILTIDPADDRSRISGWEISALGTEDIPLYATSDRRFHRSPHFLYLHDRGEAGGRRTFAITNFGSVPKIVSFDRSFAQISHDVVLAGEDEPGELLQRLLRNDGLPVLTPRDVAVLYTTRPYSIGFDSDARSFQVMVGDSLLDRISAWNRSLSAENWMGRPGLWLSTELAGQSAFLERLGKWIPRVYWHGGSPPGALIVASYSAERTLLEQAAEILRRQAFMPSTVRSLRPDQALFPASVSAPYQSPGDDRTERFTAQAALSDSHGVIEFPRPPFLRDDQGHKGWMVDLEIEFPNEAAVTGRRGRWFLPHRQHMASAFANAGRERRIAAAGLPSLRVRSVEREVKFRVPHTIEPFFALLERFTPDGRWRGEPRSFGALRPSDAGKRLEALIQLFGGFWLAHHAFDDTFWRRAFSELAGRPADRRDRLLDSIDKELRGHSESAAAPRTDLSQRELAERLAEVAFKPRSAKDWMTREQLITMFGHVTREERLRDPRNGSNRPRERFQDYAAQELDRFVADGVLLQGSRVSCPVCGTIAWKVVDDLRRDMRCEGCLSSYPLPSDLEWSFRVNSLVKEALAQHGLLTVLNALDRLGPGIREMFLFVPPCDVFEENRSDRFTDLDVLVIRDGQVVIGEVKSHPLGFRADDLGRIAIVAERVLPDMVFFAAAGTTWPGATLAEFQKVRERLLPLEIEISWDLLDW